jgi:hypothetical protein
MTEPVSVPGEAITDQSISETAKAGKVALTFFFGLTEKWGCSVAEQQLLLGSVSNATYCRYKKLPEARLSDDLIERISYLMGIHRSLRTIFSNQPDRAYQWVKKPNKAEPFNGQSALQFILTGRVNELSELRSYLDEQSGLPLS